MTSRSLDHQSANTYGRLLCVVGALITIIGLLYATPLFRSSSSDLDIRFLDVGQGDATLILPPGGGVVLVDAGGKEGDYSAGRERVLPALRRLGIGRIDLLILTHPDADHYGGAFDLLDRCSVSALATPNYESVDPEYRELLRLAARKRILIHRLSGGQIIRLAGGVQMRVVNPPAPPLPRWEHPDNNASLVLHVAYGRTSVLLMGDAERQAEEVLAARSPALRADVLRVGHHGSNTSTTTRLLRQIRPAAAVVSCGRGNPFGHPHPDVIARLQASGARVFRTDRDGPVRLLSDGARIRFFASPAL